MRAPEATHIYTTLSFVSAPRAGTIPTFKLMGPETITAQLTSVVQAQRTEIQSGLPFLTKLMAGGDAGIIPRIPRRGGVSDPTVPSAEQLFYLSQTKSTSCL